MPVGDVVQLVGAVAGVITAIGLIAAPIAVAVITSRAKRDEKAEPEIEQGQPLKTDAALKRERNAYRRALNRANDRLAEHSLPLEHPDI